MHALTLEVTVHSTGPRILAADRTVYALRAYTDIGYGLWLRVATHVNFEVMRSVAFVILTKARLTLQKFLLLSKVVSA